MGRTLREISQDIRYNSINNLKEQESVVRDFVDGANYTFDHDTEEMKEFIGEDGAAFFNGALSRHNILIEKTIRETELRTQSQCPHDLIVKVTTTHGIADVCPICGKTVYALENHKGRLIEGGPRLDCTEPSLGVSYDHPFFAKDTVIIGTFQEMIVEFADAAPEGSIIDFTATTTKTELLTKIKPKTKRR